MPGGGRLNSEPPRPTLLGGSEREPLAPPDRCPVGLLSHLEIFGPMLVERMRVLSAPSGDVRSSPRSGGQRSGRCACESAACGAALARPVPAGGVPSVTRVPRRSVSGRCWQLQAGAALVLRGELAGGAVACWGACTAAAWGSGRRRSPCRSSGGWGSEVGCQRRGSPRPAVDAFSMSSHGLLRVHVFLVSAHTAWP